MSAPIVAVVGGGQLARMMQESAAALGIHLRALVEDEEGATAQVVPDSRVGSPANDADMDWLVDGADVLTFEHEHIPQRALSRLAGRVSIQPGARALLRAQDKIEMRRSLTDAGLPCPAWCTATSLDEVAAAGERLGFPLVAKWARGGYDGHGVRVIERADQAADWIGALDPGDSLLLEAKVPFTSELAVLLARRPSGEVRHWQVMQTVQDHGVCYLVQAPAPGIGGELAGRAQDIGTRIAELLGVTGVLAVEMFVYPGPDGPQLAVNELAMRPHNSGHWTLDGAVTSQFENHLRAVLDLPLGDTRAVYPASCMVNLLGSNLAEPRAAYGSALAAVPEAKVRYYGKGVRPRRKLGHVTVCGDNAEAVRTRAQRVVQILRG